MVTVSVQLCLGRDPQGVLHHELRPIREGVHYECVLDYLSGEEKR
jgi:hypothetical protein